MSTSPLMGKKGNAKIYWFSMEQQTATYQYSIYLTHTEEIRPFRQNLGQRRDLKNTTWKSRLSRWESLEEEDLMMSR